jgi:hypothetical protein
MKTSDFLALPGTTVRNEARLVIEHLKAINAIDRGVEEHPNEAVVIFFYFDQSLLGEPVSAVRVCWDWDHEYPRAVICELFWDSENYLRSESVSDMLPQLDRIKVELDYYVKHYKKPCAAASP